MKSSDLSIKVTLFEPAPPMKKPVSKVLNLTPPPPPAIGNSLTEAIMRQNESRILRPPPGTRGWNIKGYNLVLCYCPCRFDTFQIRTNYVMTVKDFKDKVAAKYKVPCSTVTVCIREREFNGSGDESKVSLHEVMQSQRTDIAKISFREVKEQSRESVLLLQTERTPQSKRMEMVYDKDSERYYRQRKSSVIISKAPNGREATSPR
jgi:hypothetical protein